ncbi:hypothetical protein [Psychrobacter sp. FDAARGOS_221]|uniref:hypothetical protein n=1 Tax=Psychrobacter sp. FDAARGOS_221 TaxID=1975705 RepID=UPI000BB5644B|nr:hypothetical protein [Psychrobacter sp. FDAARGOS_221]PNK60145.1 hypothetical protein A6J60_004170 [Psychrobacter sp. FDAARGOS_221]
MNTEWFAQIDSQLIFIMLSALVAVLIWIEGQMLKKTNGKIPKTAFFKFCAVVDFLWVPISIGAMYLFDMDGIYLTVPIAYQIYAVAGWVYSNRLFKRKGTPDIEKFEISESYISFCQSFALVFFVLCVAVTTYALIT